MAVTGAAGIYPVRLVGVSSTMNVDSSPQIEGLKLAEQASGSVGAFKLTPSKGRHAIIGDGRFLGGRWSSSTSW